ncbi:MAG: hypothetical protein FD155_3072 [Bacteroidetes bacterium]|nr:MAG: hypothetical protein FD155_3072 [Bacteroidota bacterium]
MKTKIQHSLIILLMVVAMNAMSQQSGLAWFKSIASSGVDHSPGIAIDTAGQVFIAVNFSSPLALEAGGGSDTLDPGLHGEAIVAQISTENGSLVRYFHLSSPGHIAITGIGFYLQRLVVSGSCHDSVFIKPSGGQASYLGGGTGIHTGFQLFCGIEGDNPTFTQPASAALRAGFERICVADSLLVTTGKYLPDSVAARRVMITKGAAGSRPVYLPGNTYEMELNDLGFAFGHLFVCGSFRDSLQLYNSTLYALAGKDAFVALADTIDSTYLNIPLSWHGLQDAHAVALATYDASLWVAVNFSDTLHHGVDQRLDGRGGGEAALFRYDSLLQLQATYHLKGNRSERIEKLFVSANKLYVLANVSSDSCELIHTGNSPLPLGHSYGTGAHTLLSIDTSGAADLVWMAREGRLGRLTGVHKISPTETLLSGLYGNTITIDSVPYEPYGIQNVYVLRIDDLCLSRLKTSKETFKFCQGDSLLLAYALPSPGNVLQPTEKSSDQFYVSRPGTYIIPYESECGCLDADTLQFEWYKPRPGENPLAVVQSGINAFRLAEGGIIELRYAGECTQAYEPRQAQFSLQPNPSKTHSYLMATLPEAGVLLMELTDGHGAVVWQNKHTLVSGSHQLPVAVQTLQPGSYFLRLHFDTGLKTSHAVLKLTRL